MANTTFVSGTVIDSGWLNDVNKAVYTVLGDGTVTADTKEEARTFLETPKVDGTAATGTWGINITGSAATAVTQSPNNNSTAIATTAYVDASVGGSGGITLPKGRLTIASGEAVLDQTLDYSSTTLYYAPYDGISVPIFNGTTWATYTFTSTPTDTVGLSMSTTWATSSRFDVFVIVSAGVPVLCTGPAWPSSTLAARNLQKHSGIWTSSSSLLMTLNGGSTTTVAANQATWVGSINVGSVAGTLTATFTLGQNRRCDVWNVYNQEEVLLGVGAPPPSVGATRTWAPTNTYPTMVAYNNDTNNAGFYFTGLPQNVELEYHQRGFVDSLNFGVCAAIVSVGIDGVGSTFARGTLATNSSDATSYASSIILLATYNDRSSIGSHTAYMMGSNANGTDGVTLWGLNSVVGRDPGDAQTMWIRYLG